jgi:small subunit ribosomal protein S20
MSFSRISKTATVSAGSGLMPHTRSARKNLRKSEKHRIANRAGRKAIKKQIKVFLEAVEGPIEELKKQYDLTAKRLDQAAAKRIIHPNLAARKKSQLARKVLAKTQASKPA